MKKIVRFLVEVKKEMKKVRWISKKEMLKYSIATLSIMVVLGFFFFASDLILGSVKVLVG